MKNKLLTLALPISFLCSVSAFAGANDDKVNICHIPPGNPSNVKSISVGAPAANSHIMEHGDYLVTSEGTPELCRNGFDDDCDGLTDCQDSDCDGVRCDTDGSCNGEKTCSAAQMDCIESKPPIVCEDCDPCTQGSCDDEDDGSFSCEYNADGTDACGAFCNVSGDCDNIPGSDKACVSNACVYTKNDCTPSP